MGRGGKRPGAGRPKGAPNKVTAEAKALFLEAFGNLQGDLEGWIRATAADDPAKAADLTIKLAEYHFPKLGRREITGPDGAPIRVVKVDMDE